MGPTSCSAMVSLPTGRGPVVGTPIHPAPTPMITPPTGWRELGVCEVTISGATFVERFPRGGRLATWPPELASPMVLQRTTHRSDDVGPPVHDLSGRRAPSTPDPLIQLG